MYKIVYVSQATNQLSGKAGIEKIVETARTFNRPNNITGILLYHAGLFFQMLEGDEQLVKTLFENKIKKDPRHEGVVVIFEGPMSATFFKTWSMAYHSMSDLDINLVNEILAWQTLMNGQKITADILSQLVNRFNQFVKEEGQA
jgi:hypothetical protein